MASNGSGTHRRPTELPLNSHSTHGTEYHTIESDEQGYVPPGARHLQSLAYSGVPQSGRQTASDGKDSPPSDHVQFATYHEEPKLPEPHYGSYNPRGHHTQEPPGPILDVEPWTPLPLQTWFWLTYVIILALGAIGLEVALHYSNKNKGWSVVNALTATEGFMHYVYTFPAVAIAMLVTSIWAWTDFEIKKMQPYVDLTHGDAPPQRSLLLDYTRANNFFVWSIAARNRHYVVALASLMVILTLCISPLSGSLLTVRDTYLAQADQNVTVTGAIGANLVDSYRDLTAFVTAAGFASASILYNLGEPNFVHDSWTLPPMEFPSGFYSNGTLIFNTTAVKSDPGCVPPDTTPNMQRVADGSGWNNSALYQGCNYTWSVNKAAKNLFGTSVLSDTNCDVVKDIPEESRPIALWFFTYLDPKPATAITFCAPKISTWRVEAHMDIASGNITDVRPLSAMDPPARGNGTLEEVLNGRAFNGVWFDYSTLVTTEGDPYVRDRETSTQLQLPAAVYQAALQSKTGLRPSFDTDAFLTLSTRIYQMYLQLFAKSVYMVPSTLEDPILVQINTTRKRLWLSDVAVHFIAAALFILAVVGTIVHLLHRADRLDLRLGHAPGTIASAVSLGAQTSVGAVLAGRQNEADIDAALADKRFRIDPRTNKIVMEGDEDYEHAGTPNPKRASVLHMMRLGLQPASPTTRAARRASHMPGMPMSPIQPRSPLSAPPPGVPSENRV